MIFIKIIGISILSGVFFICVYDLYNSNKKYKEVKKIVKKAEIELEKLKKENERIKKGIIYIN